MIRFTLTLLHFGHLIFFFSYSEIFKFRSNGFLHFSQINSYVGMLNLLSPIRFSSGYLNKQVFSQDLSRALSLLFWIYHEFDLSVPFFQKSGKAKYYFDRLYVVDIQCSAQAIDTLSYFAGFDDSSLRQALKVAEWTIKNMKHRNGYFFYQKNRYLINRTPYMRWVQAWMFKALSILTCYKKKDNKLRRSNKITPTQAFQLFPRIKFIKTTV